MRVLLDTHVLLWWRTDPTLLEAAARDLIADPSTELLWSAASTWEIGIKQQLGKLRLPEPLGTYLTRCLREESLLGLPIQHTHAVQAAELPLLHRDPFDRLLVAQALVEAVPLVTRDARLADYGVTCIPA